MATRLQPQRWTPPADPGLQGPWEKNERLADVQVVAVPGEGPEDTAFGADGTVFTGVEDGSVLALDGGAASQPSSISARSWRVVGNTGGRPGGIEVAADGGLLIADYRRGLLRMDPTSGEVDVLVEHAHGHRLRCTNNLAVHPDGRIFFSTSSDRFDVEQLRLDAIEHTATGRLWVHDPSDGSTEVVVDGLSTANGVAVGADGAWVAVANTSGYDIDRVWLEGPQTGHRDKLVPSLPGMPDNLSLGSDGRIWLALVVPRNPILEILLPRRPALRVALAKVPDRVVPDGPRCAMAFALDPTTGAVLENLQCWQDSPYHYVTGVNEAPDGRIWLSSIRESGLAVHTPT